MMPSHRTLAPSASPAGQRRHDEAGFTLLEVVIAIALTAMIGVAVAGLVNSLVTTQERFAESPRARQDTLFARHLEDRLRALVPRALHESGQAMLNARLRYRPDIGRLEWVALVGGPVALDDRVSRLRRQRLSWNRETGDLQLASTGLLDARDVPDWQLDAQLTDIAAIEATFFINDQWQASPVTASARQVQGIRVRWQRHGQVREIVAPLPEPRP